MVSPCHDLFTGLVIQFGARSLGIPEFGPTAGQSNTRLELPSSPLPWSGSDSFLPIMQEAALCYLCSEPWEQKLCLKGTCHLQGNKIRGGAWARSCSNGGRGGLRKSWHSREDHTALNASSVLEPRGQNSNGMAETRDAESHPQGWAG